MRRMGRYSSLTHLHILNLIRCFVSYCIIWNGPELNKDVPGDRGDVSRLICCVRSLSSEVVFTPHRQEAMISCSSLHHFAHPGGVVTRIYHSVICVDALIRGNVQRIQISLRSSVGIKTVHWYACHEGAARGINRVYIHVTEGQAGGLVCLGDMEKSPQYFGPDTSIQYSKG